MELEKCICGGMPTQRTYLGTLCETGRIHYIECLKCGKQTNDYKTKYNAERAWNNWMKKIKTIKPGERIHISLTNSTSNISSPIDFYISEIKIPATYTVSNIPPKTDELKESSKFKTWWNKYLGFIYVMEVK